MSLKQTIQNDVKEALKSGQAEKRMTLGMLLAAVKTREIEKRSKFTSETSDATELDAKSQLDDAEVVEVLSSELKKRRDSIAQYESAGRPELADKEKDEIDMIMAYMPEQMSEEAIKAEAQKTISEVGAAGPKDMGKVLGALMPKVKGKADGQLVSKIVKELLGA